MIDEVQLEEGSRATPFQARHPVAAAIEARRGQQMCKLFRMAEPLTLHLPIYNDEATAHTGGIVIVVERMDGSTVLEEAMTDPIPPGHSEIVFARDFGLVGDFVARVFAPDGTEIGANRYQFRSVPVIPENAQFIIVSRAGAAEQVPAERVWLPWNNEENWYADPPQGLTITDAGNIYVAFDKNRLLKTRDGGRSWEALPATRQALGVCRDGTLINVDREREGESLSGYRSADEGESWVLAGVLVRAFRSAPVVKPTSQSFNRADYSALLAIGRRCRATSGTCGCNTRVRYGGSPAAAAAVTGPISNACFWPTRTTAAKPGRTCAGAPSSWKPCTARLSSCRTGGWCCCTFPVPCHREAEPGQRSVATKARAGMSSVIT